MDKLKLTLSCQPLSLSVVLFLFYIFFCMLMDFQK